MQPPTAPYSEPLIAEICAGYGGLSMAIEAVLGGRVVLVADNDPGPSLILAERYPGVPNVGDITVADWSRACRVDILCGGFPCTDVSSAGKRAGLLHGTRSGVWHHMARAIGETRPPLVVIENVRGLLTARGDEPTPEHLAAEASRDALERLLAWLDNEANIAYSKGEADRVRNIAARTARVMGARKRAVARCQWHERRLVRAIGTVLGSLSDQGYDTVWTLVSASDVGAPHRRERIFILAWPSAADPSRQGLQGRGGHRGRDAVAPLEGSGRVFGSGDSSGIRGQVAADPVSEPVRRQPRHVGSQTAAVAGNLPAAAGRGGERVRADDSDGSAGTTQDPDVEPRDEWGIAATGETESRRARADTGGSGGTRPAAPADTVEWRGSARVTEPAPCGPGGPPEPADPASNTGRVGHGNDVRPRGAANRRGAAARRSALADAGRERGHGGPDVEVDGADQAVGGEGVDQARGRGAPPATADSGRSAGGRWPDEPVGGQDRGAVAAVDSETGSGRSLAADTGREHG